MTSRLLPALCAVLTLSGAPAWALQTVTLPQPADDGSSPYQSSSSPAQSTFSNDQSGTTDSSLGHFHFNMSSGSGFAGDQGFANNPGYYYRPDGSSSAGYGTSNQPGSEFFNSGYPFPH